MLNCSEENVQKMILELIVLTVQSFVGIVQCALSQCKIYLVDIVRETFFDLTQWVLMIQY